MLDIPQAGFINQVGAPMLASEGLFVVVPDNAEYRSLTVKLLRQEELPEKYNLLPTPRDVLETEELVFAKDSGIYKADEDYPQEAVRYIGTVEILGTRCLHLAVCPFIYRPLSQKLTVLREIVITVNYTIVGSKANVQAGVSRDVIENTRYASQLLGYKRAASKDGDDAKPRMIIVTAERLGDSLKILEGVKSFLYDVEIAYIEKIDESCEGNDLAEKIRSYLLAEHGKSPLSYVILGGGVDMIPTKMITDNVQHKDELIANDNYYCSDDMATPLPIYALGRLPVSAVCYMNEVVDYASYYDRFYNDNRKKAVFTSYNAPSHTYEQCKRNIKSTLVGDFSVAECYDGLCSQTELIQEINKGVGFINYRGHGGCNGWLSGNGLSVKDIPSLTVERETPNVLSLACHNCGIHQSVCFGVEWIKQLKAISFLGASASSYTAVNDLFDKYLWEGIHQKKLTKIGDIFVWGTLELYRNNPESETIDNIREYLLLGDPSADYMDDKSDKQKGERS
ncbi:MAG: C25 family cysteine peptidase [Cloacibacillus sp.]